MNKKITILRKHCIPWILLMCTTLFSAGEPRWFKNSGLPQYSTTLNYVGVGEGTTFSDAQSAAQAAISAQLEVTVASTIEMQTSAVETEEASYFKDVFEQNTQSTIEQTVKGIEIVKRKKSKGRYYVFGILNKKRYIGGLKVELDQLWSKISSYVVDARQFSKSGRIFPALENYMDVQEFIPGFYTKKVFYDAISPAPFVVFEDITIGDVLTEMREILSGVNISVESGNRQSALVGGPLPNPVVFSAYLKKRGDKIPIPNLPLIVKYEDGSVVERISTQEDGSIESYITANPTNSKGGKIFASTNLTGLPNAYREYLKNAEAFATYKITKSPPITFTLRVTDENNSRLKKVESTLTKNIEKMGYSVGEDAELLLDGKITIIDEKEVDGKSGRQFLVTAELDMFMIAKMNGDKVASFDAIGKGLSKKNIKDANKKAYKKLKISKKNLGNMLSEADEELRRIFTKKSALKLREGKGLYDQGKLRKAIVPLTKVTHDEGQVEEAINLIGKIKKEINRIEQERLARIEEEKRKKREHEMELAELAAATERARQQADLEIAASMAAAQVSSAKIKADADVMVAKYGVDEAEMNARAAEASAMAEESKVAIEQIKRDTEIVKLDQLKAQESIVVAEAEAEVAKTNAIAFAARLSDQKNQKTNSGNILLTKEEKSLVGDWNYLGTINPISGDEDYNGAGSILSILNDRTFSDEGTTGHWEVGYDNDKNTNFLINSSYPMPYTLDGTNLIMSVDVNGNQFLRIYEKY